METHTIQNKYIIQKCIGSGKFGKVYSGIYKKTNEVNQLLSGGTNSLTAKLARQVGVRFQGASIGTFARQIVKEIVDDDDFYKNNELIKKGYLIAKDLVIANVGEINE